ncbi:MAG TPA: Asp-tRNA(Asn)/Glu-tRNA(Gln) amidotransferase subunit GatC [Gemmatimonadales bacterium]|jgi:aspartyl-tRNA(Asn)/glutamyl-tRNA(Gln) amidotransferase subunit C
MSIRKEDVLHVARLAELDVTEEDLPRLVEQTARIVAFVAQLNEVPASEEAPPFLAGPKQVTLRPDEIRPDPLARPPARMAPEFREGFFAVPKLGAMEEAE